MRYKHALLVAAALFAVAVSVSSASGEGVKRAIVVFKPGITTVDEHRVIQAHGGTVISDLKRVSAVAASVPSSSIDDLVRTNAVLRVDPDNLNYIVAYPVTAPAAKAGGGGSGGGGQVIQYGVSKMVRRDASLPSAWDASRGAGTKVAILDTGIDTDHPDLVANIRGGINTAGSNPLDIEDRNGHGTHVAGIIGAADNAIGVVGVAPSTNLYAVKVFSGAFAYDSDIIEGISWAIDNGMNAINMSLGTSPGAPANPSFQAIVNQAHNAGIVIFAASGNDGVNTDVAGPVYPAAYDNVLAVSAVDSSDNIASFSNIGSLVDFSAPGVSNKSTYKGNGYKSLSGTSMATPHAVGAALLRIAQKLSTATPDAAFADSIAADLAQTAVDRGPAGKDVVYGYGIPNGQSLVVLP